MALPSRFLAGLVFLVRVRIIPLHRRPGGLGVARYELLERVTDLQVAPLDETRDVVLESVDVSAARVYAVLGRRGEGGSTREAEREHGRKKGSNELHDCSKNLEVEWGGENERLLRERD